MLVVVGASARPAPAQDADGNEARRRKASHHVRRGDAFKEAADYPAAAREYEDAYALVPHPVLFFNLAQVYRLGGERERAIEFYERYLAADPDGRASRQARRFAAQLRRERAHQRAAAARRGSRTGRSGATPAAGSIARSPPPPRSGRGLRIAGVVAASAGLVAIGVGVKFGLDARAISSDIDAHTQGEWPEELLARQAEGERAERNMLILTGAGAAAVAAGGLLYYLGRSARQAAEPGVAVSPVTTGDRVGLVVSGRF